VKKLKATLPNRTLVRFIRESGMAPAPDEIIDGLYEELGDSVEAVRGFMICLSATVSQLQGMLAAAAEEHPHMGEIMEVPVLHFMRLYVAMAEQPYILTLLEADDVHGQQDD
jgi:hypothetical protein